MKGTRLELAIRIGFCAGILLLMVTCSSDPVSEPWPGTAFEVEDVPASLAPEKVSADGNTLSEAPEIQWTPLPVEKKKKTAPAEPPNSGATEEKRPESVVKAPPVTPPQPAEAPPAEVENPEEDRPATHPEPLAESGRKATDREKPVKAPPALRPEAQPKGQVRPEEPSIPAALPTGRAGNTTGSGIRKKAIHRDPEAAHGDNQGRRQTGTGKKPVKVGEEAGAPATEAPPVRQDSTPESPPDQEGKVFYLVFWIVSALAPLVLALAIFWILGSHRTRFKRELREILGVEWRGNMPVSQLLSFVQAHRLLYDRLVSFQASLEDRQSNAESFEDEKTQRVIGMAMSVEQRRQHILRDIQELAEGKKGAHNSLDRALRIHAGRMGLLEAHDGFVAAMNEMENVPVEV